MHEKDSAVHDSNEVDYIHLNVYPTISGISL